MFLSEHDKNSRSENMSAKSEEKNKKLVLQTLIFGAITAVLYAAVFANASPIVELFSRGGYYAASSHSHGVCFLLRARSLFQQALVCPRNRSSHKAGRETPDRFSSQTGTEASAPPAHECLA